MSEPSDPNPGRRPETVAPATTPRWVKIFGIVALTLVAAFALIHLTVGGLGGHGPSQGPGQHAPHEVAR